MQEKIRLSQCLEILYRDIRLPQPISDSGWKGEQCLIRVHVYVYIYIMYMYICTCVLLVHSVLCIELCLHVMGFYCIESEREKDREGWGIEREIMVNTHTHTHTYIVIIANYRSSVSTEVSLHPSPPWTRSEPSTENKRCLTTDQCVTFCGLIQKVSCHWQISAPPPPHTHTRTY